MTNVHSRRSRDNFSLLKEGDRAVPRPTLIKSSHVVLRKQWLPFEGFLGHSSIGRWKLNRCLSPERRDCQRRSHPGGSCHSDGRLHRVLSNCKERLFCNLQCWFCRPKRNDYTLKWQLQEELIVADIGLGSQETSLLNLGLGHCVSSVTCKLSFAV